MSTRRFMMAQKPGTGLEFSSGVDDELRTHQKNHAKHKKHPRAGFRHACDSINFRCAAEHVDSHKPRTGYIGALPISVQGPVQIETSTTTSTCVQFADTDQVAPRKTCPSQTGIHRP